MVASTQQQLDRNVMVSIHDCEYDETIECVLTMDVDTGRDTTNHFDSQKAGEEHQMKMELKASSQSIDEVDTICTKFSELSLDETEHMVPSEDSTFSIVPYHDIGIEPRTPIREVTAGQKKMKRYSPYSVLEDIQSGGLEKESIISHPFPFKPSASLPKMMPMTPSCSATTLSTECEQSMYPTDEYNDSISVGSTESEESYDDLCLYSTPTRSFEVRDTIEMPLVSEQQLKMISVRKTNLEAKLLEKKEQQERRERMQIAASVLCLLVDFVYEGPLSLVGTAATIILLTC